MKHVEQTAWYKNPYVWLIITFPLTAVVAGIYTIYLAVESDDGLVSDDYYKDGLEINRLLERDERASQLGLSAAVNLDVEAKQLKILLTSNPGFVYPETIQAKFLNRTRKGFDKEVTMTYSSGALYVGELPELISGKWYVQIETEEWRVLESLDN